MIDKWCFYLILQIQVIGYEWDLIGKSSLAKFGKFWVGSLLRILEQVNLKKTCRHEQETRRVKIHNKTWPYISSWGETKSWFLSWKNPQWRGNSHAKLALPNLRRDFRLLNGHSHGWPNNRYLKKKKKCSNLWHLVISHTSVKNPSDYRTSRGQKIIYRSTFCVHVITS